MSSCTDDPTPLPSNLDAGVALCRAQETTPPPSGPDASSPVDGGTTVTLSVPATHASMSGVSVNVTGAAPDAPFSPRLVGGTGTVRLDGVDVAAAVIAHQVFVGYDLYQALAVSSDRLTLLWYYCAHGALEWSYAEDTRGLVAQSEFLAGTCDLKADEMTLSVDFPATSFAPPPLVHGYRVNGTSLAYDGETAGRATLGISNYGLYPFASVDCTVGGWRELHTLVWSPSQSMLGVAILYLFPPAAMRAIQLSYGVMLPSGIRLDEIVFPDAVWATTGP